MCGGLTLIFGSLVVSIRRSVFRRYSEVRLGKAEEIVLVRLGEIGGGFR